MDIRNIQRTGGKSFSLTLPKNWITSNRMKDKDKVKIFDHNQHLVVVPFTYKKGERYVTCPIDNLTKAQIYREIIGYYLSGVENIIVRANQITLEQRTAVRQISYRLIGCECLESGADYMTLKNVSSTVSNSIHDYVRKMVLILISMYQDTCTFLETSDRALAQDIIDRDIELDRLHLAIIRSNNIRLTDRESDEAQSKSLFDTHFYEIVAIRLERIGDHIVRMGKYFLLQDKQYDIIFTPIERTMIKKTHMHLETCQEMIYAIDKKKAHTYLDTFDEFINLHKTKKYTNKDSFHLAIAESISRINSYIANIAEEVINFSNVKASVRPN